MCWCIILVKMSIILFHFRLLYKGLQNTYGHHISRMLMCVTSICGELEKEVIKSFWAISCVNLGQSPTFWRMSLSSLDNWDSGSLSNIVRLLIWTDVADCLKRYHETFKTYTEEESLYKSFTCSVCHADKNMECHNRNSRNWTSTCQRIHYDSVKYVWK